MSQELMYQIALTRIPQIGDIIIKKLLETFGSAGAIFSASRYNLERTETIGSVRAAAIRQFRDFNTIEKEITFIERYHIRPLFYTDKDYPERLRHCIDSPAMLYYKGNASLNPPRIVNVVGTRHPSGYGRQVCVQLVKELTEAGITLVSGLAYGIDIMAHRTALEMGIPTVGVLAHGLDRIYPALHKETAIRMTEQGGLLTEFLSGTGPDRQNFPRRNRIVAGLCDATIVVESGIQGGSLITADLANGYNRDVFCIPGRVHDIHAAGCNHLIKNNKAMLITDAADVIEVMGWQKAAGVAAVMQRTLFPDLTEAEKLIVDLFSRKSPLHLEELYLQSHLSGSQVAAALFNLEMQSVLKCLPGQLYELV
ncbi:MAG TPA: DNA-processing protein DprA [Chitinophaga sp.]|uniref:DNA-processing protein DprA n=1 Tax=Chitinophaga sp. TaxID=1869181 RepID=UPI002C4E7E83|nr:DNA-processing protein DprA [Chitinophaga sp.]HVI46583.1 DNA-processing protein DprA [Chitinophaga sp.]